jgi:hypothetical protein
MKSSKFRAILALSIVSLPVIACGAFFRMPQYVPESNESPPAASSEGSAANVERIYFTALI